METLSTSNTCVTHESNGTYTTRTTDSQGNFVENTYIPTFNNGSSQDYRVNTRVAYMQPFDNSLSDESTISFVRQEQHYPQRTLSQEEMNIFIEKYKGQNIIVAIIKEVFEIFCSVFTAKVK